MQENTIPTPSANGIDQAQFEADKRAVYKHPLFSLLALLLEKCELATQGYSSTSNSSSPNGSTNGNIENDDFSRDYQAFVQLLEKEDRPLLTNDEELDGLMIKALQVLRIHLIEIRKVDELCKDFCSRYIACLRGKMQSENLLRADYPLEHNNNLSNSNSPINSPEQEQITNQSGGYFGNSEYLTSNDRHEYSNEQGAFHSIQTNNTQRQSLIDSSPNDIPPVTGLPLTGLPPQTVTSQQASAMSSQILGSTPLSLIGCPPLTIDQYAGQLSPCASSDEMDSEIDSNNDDIGSNFSNNSGSKRQKRGILPKHATSVMRAWLFQHLVHPYPTEDEKRAIAAQTNLTLLQVNNWFINARRRILQPMLEHANDNSNSARKKSPQNSSKQFWTENSLTSSTTTTPTPTISSTLDGSNSINSQTQFQSLLVSKIEDICSNLNRKISANQEEKLKKKIFNNHNNNRSDNNNDGDDDDDDDEDDDDIESNHDGLIIDQDT